eukprot:2011968-Alexandrium_andersonii.AAC.1
MAAGSAAPATEPAAAQALPPAGTFEHAQAAREARANLGANFPHRARVDGRAAVALRGQARGLRLPGPCRGGWPARRWAGRSWATARSPCSRNWSCRVRWGEPGGWPGRPGSRTARRPATQPDQAGRDHPDAGRPASRGARRDGRGRCGWRARR